jgi:hypothetical protein
MPSAILTDGATFTCPHKGTGTIATGILISALSELVTIGGHRPILAGASITGFTAASGCIFSSPAGSQPCVGFILPPPSEQTLTIGGQAVYTAADAAAIALAQSTGNGQPGLTRTEEFTVVGADRLPVRFSTIFCPRFNTTGELLVLSSLVSIGGIHGQSWPEVSRLVWLGESAQDPEPPARGSPRTSELVNPHSIKPSSNA